MKEWRGLILQLAALATLVALVSVSRNASPEVIHFALGAVGTMLGQMVARARVDAASGSAASAAGGGRSIPPIVGGAIGFVVTFAVWRALV